jgi:hypothetical protein
MGSVDKLGAGGWRTSSRCAHGDCVEVGSGPAAVVAVRDTQDHGTGPGLAFTPVAWRSFVTGLKHGPASASALM